MSSLEKINIHFFGSPEFALPSLELLHSSPEINISCVVSGEDQPSGRGLSMQSPPIGKRAKELNIPLFQPSSLRKINWDITPLESNNSNPSIQVYIDFLNSNPKPDFFIVVAYGKIIPEKMLKYPTVDTLNVHPSLLPRWRGAAPMQRTLFFGDTKTGVCIMKLLPELDTGPVYKKEEYLIKEEENLLSLHNYLSNSGARLLLDTILSIKKENIKPIPQNEDGVTYAEKWKNEESIINWSDSADNILNLTRAISPKPGARTTLNNNVFKILSAKILEDSITKRPQTSGILFPISSTRLGVSCGKSTLLELLEVQLAGKKPMQVSDFLKGQKIEGEVILG